MIITLLSFSQLVKSDKTFMTNLFVFLHCTSCALVDFDESAQVCGALARGSNSPSEPSFLTIRSYVELPSQSNSQTSAPTMLRLVLSHVLMVVCLKSLEGLYLVEVSIPPATCKSIEWAIDSRIHWHSSGLGTNSIFPNHLMPKVTAPRNTAAHAPPF